MNSDDGSDVGGNPLENELTSLERARQIQEEQLNWVLTQSGEVRKVTLMIGDELKNQNQKLSDVNRHMDNVQNKIEGNVGKMGKLIHSKQAPLFWVAIFLTIALLILIFLIL